MTAREIARTLGGALALGRSWLCRCPAHDDRSPSLSLRDGEDGRILMRCFAGCDPRDVLAELRRRGLISGRDERRPAPPVARGDNRDGDARRDPERRIEIARGIWHAARDARGSPVARYLAGRGITIPPPSTLRWTPRCWHREARAHLPAMLGLVQHVERGIVGLHRTYLTADCRRRDRASLGPVAGGAVRLAPVGELLMVGEGIETCLAGMQVCAIPAWSALSTSGLVALVLPASVRTVIILADHDANGAGERAARTAAARWLAEGRRVRIAMPPEPGADFNDVLAGRAYARIEEVSDAAA